MTLERGSSLIEALLLIGLFLLFVVMVNHAITGYWRGLQKAEGISTTLLDQENERVQYRIERGEIKREGRNE